MIEFIFGLYPPDSLPPTVDDIGFKSINTGKAMINGVDASLSAQGKAGPVNLQLFAGYTYMNPLDLSRDTTGVDTSDQQILKYRYRHSAKGDVAIFYKTLDAGITLVYRSFMERIDPAFEEEILGQYFFPGLKEYRQKNNKGAVVFDLRLGWQITPSSKISIFLKNLFNKEYMGRPGDIQPPRSISLQYLLKI
jgi:iron complex outermembrane receptor protein